MEHLRRHQRAGVYFKAARSVPRSSAHLWGDGQGQDDSGSRRAATAARRDQKGRGGIVTDPESDPASTAASTCALPMILHPPSRSRIAAKEPVAEFTRQRSQVRYLSRPPAQTLLLRWFPTPVVSTLSADAPSGASGWPAARRTHNRRLPLT